MAEFRKFRVEAENSTAVVSKRGNIDPIGYDAVVAKEPSGLRSSQGSRSNIQARQDALFAQAKSPIKNVLMMCFMMWMSGSQLHLFSIMTTASGVYQPLSAILKSAEAFPADPDGQLDTLSPRLVYCLINALGLAFACYKLNGMGLFPTQLTDWAGTLEAPVVKEMASTGLW